MTKEIKPDYLYMNGKITPWNEATVHIWSEVAIRGANVFDSIRAYWNPSTASYNLLALDEHIERLLESARLLKIPNLPSLDEIKEGVIELLHTLDFREHTFIRPTIYIESGRYGRLPEETEVGYYIVAFPTPHSNELFTGIKCCVSSWRRSNELTISPRIKAGSSYMALRLPKIEAIEGGYDDAILLNDQGTVSEATGATLFIVKKDKIITPPVHAGILESITREKLMLLLLEEMGYQVIEREIARTELYSAQEVFLCGTLSEVQPVINIDGYTIGSGAVGNITSMLQKRFLNICELEESPPQGWLTKISTKSTQEE